VAKGAGEHGSDDRREHHQVVVRRLERPHDSTTSSTDPRVTGRPPLAEHTLMLERVVALGLRRRTAYECYVKPVLDRMLAAALLVLFLPVLALTALAVWLTLGSPILLRQPRIGRHGRRFHMFKFRTMHPDRRRLQCPGYRGQERRVAHKSADDPRHTRLGRKLRKASLDELPQLFNVLRGDMSLIGPRPELVQVVEHYKGWQHARHTVKPGITGLWQVTERPNGRLMHECIDIDLVYIERLSLRSDVAIVLRTPVALLRRDRVI
jgi:lipopolysaccharide/colanic/teichoic acid biosynthesis glycosyltransferase